MPENEADAEGIEDEACLGAEEDGAGAGAAGGDPVACAFAAARRAACLEDTGRPAGIASAPLTEYSANSQMNAL